MADVNVTFGAKDQGLSAAFERVRKEADGIKQGFALAVGAVAAVAGAFATLKVAVDSVKNFANFAGEVSDLQAKTGLAIGPLLVLRQAFENAGIGGEAMAGAVRKLQQNLVNASEGSGEAVAAFSKLGINFADIINLPVDQQIEIVGRAINSLQGDAQKTAAAIDVFGKSGANLLAVFKDSAAIETARAQIGGLAENLGTSIGALDKLSDAIQAAEKNKGFQFLAGFAQGFSGDIEKAADAINKIDLSESGKAMGEIAKGATVLAEAAAAAALDFAKIVGLGEVVTSQTAKQAALFAASQIGGAAQIEAILSYFRQTGAAANKVEASEKAIADATAQAAAEASKTAVATEQVAQAAAGSSEIWDRGVQGIRDSVALTDDFAMSLTPAVDSVADVGQYFFDAATNVEGLSNELDASLKLSAQQASIAEEEANSRDKAVQAVKALKAEIASQQKNLSTAEAEQTAAVEQLSTIAGAAPSARERAKQNRPISAGGIGERATRIKAAQNAERLSTMAEEARAFGDPDKAKRLEGQASDARKKAFGEGVNTPEDKLTRLNGTVDDIKSLITTLEQKLPTNSLVP
jgi:hypothetical protein